MAQLKYLDYSTYLVLMEQFAQTDAYCQKNNVKLSEHICKALFIFFDTDESGELEPEELSLFEKHVMGQSSDQKAQQDAKQLAIKYWKSTKQWFSEVTGLI